MHGCDPVSSVQFKKIQEKKQNIKHLKKAEDILCNEWSQLFCAHMHLLSTRYCLEVKMFINRCCSLLFIFLLLVVAPTRLNQDQNFISDCTDIIKCVQ